MSVDHSGHRHVVNTAEMFGAGQILESQLIYCYFEPVAELRV